LQFQTNCFIKIILITSKNQPGILTILSSIIFYPVNFYFTDLIVFNRRREKKSLVIKEALTIKNQGE